MNGLRYLSVFSGLEGAHLAWGPLGWECAGVAEIEPASCKLLAQRLNASAPKYLPPWTPKTDPKTGKPVPNPYDRKLYRHLKPFGTPGTLPNFGDVSQVTDEDIASVGHVDVLIGGSPCQDLSVAGKRAGLSGSRSSLFHEQLRIFHAARTFCGCRWLLWENVPGAFSIHKGRDFACVVGALAGCEFLVPRDGWGGEGVAAGPAGLVEWSVLDAQWFGVAQRRRRVFAVLDSGNWSGRPPVLLERESVRGDFAPVRETWQRVAAPITRGSERGSGYRNDPDTTENLVAGTLQTSCKAAGSATQQDAECGLLIAFGGNNTRRSIDVATARNACGSGRMDFESETFLVLHDPIAFSCKDHAADAADAADAVAPTLRAMGYVGSHANAGGQVAVAFHPTQDPINSSEVCHTIGANANANATAAVAVALRGRQGGSTAELGDDCGHALRASQGGGDKPHVLAAMAVRRLTPMECERLQGVPDGWTAVMNGKKPMADGPRYKMLGNGFAVPVIAWIGKQIQAAHYYGER